MPFDYPRDMTVILADPPGGPDVMRLASRPVPKPAAGEVLIRVHAAGVNGADLREREGKYPVPPGAPDIMGLEVSGEIVAVGEGCSRFQSGDQVCALLIGGGYAEYALAPEGQCMLVPQTVSLTDAAGLPEVFCTVWTNMMDRCGLEGSESVLIQGGTSGIGHAAISLARACGATVFATARTEENALPCGGLVRITQSITAIRILLKSAALKPTAGVSMSSSILLAAIICPKRWSCWHMVAG